MGKEVEATEQLHDVIVVPYPAQGHINPALAFAKCLDSKGLKITIITTTKLIQSAQVSLCSSISIQTISDGSEQVNEPETVEAYFIRFKNAFSKNLANFIDQQSQMNINSPKIIVYDSTMPWILDIAHNRGLLGASFFTQSCGVCAIYYHLKQGSLKFPYEEDGSVSLPCLPALGMNDLPSFSPFMDPKHTVMRLLADQFSNIEDVDWIFFNTFDKLEDEIVNWMVSRWRIKTVGPTLLLLDTDKKLSTNYNHHMISLFEPNYEECQEWLDTRQSKSVVYVSFGSIASLGKEQMEELAYGLMMSNSYFLWVVRPSEVDKLPPNFASEKGLIVQWCHQPQVLAHRAVSYFMTHCGWNSTLEALSYGVPLIAMGQWVDQTTNSKFIEDVWGVGVKVKASENGIVTREEVAKCIEEVSEGDKGIKLKRNACKLRKLANEAVGKGGTSSKNIDDFVSKLMCC